MNAAGPLTSATSRVRARKDFAVRSRVTILIAPAAEPAPGALDARRLADLEEAAP